MLQKLKHVFDNAHLTLKIYILMKKKHETACDLILKLNFPIDKLLSPKIFFNFQFRQILTF